MYTHTYTYISICSPLLNLSYKNQCVKTKRFHPSYYVLWDPITIPMITDIKKKKWIGKKKNSTGKLSVGD